MAMDHNLSVDTSSAPGSAGIFAGGSRNASAPFPGDTSFAGWQKGGHDAHSLGAVNGGGGGGGGGWSWETFAKQGGGTAGARLGIAPLQVDDAGPDW